MQQKEKVASVINYRLLKQQHGLFSSLLISALIHLLSAQPSVQQTLVL